MKQNKQAKTFFTNTSVHAATLKPAAPFTARQANSDRRVADPSSVLRSDRYPIPSSFEYRMRASD